MVGESGFVDSLPYEHRCQICSEPATTKIKHKASWLYILRTYGLTGLLNELNPITLIRTTASCDKHLPELVSRIPKKHGYSLESV